MDEHNNKEGTHMAGVERLDPDPFARGVSGLEFKAPEAVGGHLRPVHARGRRRAVAAACSSGSQRRRTSPRASRDGEHDAGRCSLDRQLVTTVAAACSGDSGFSSSGYTTSVVDATYDGLGNNGSASHYYY